MSNEKTKPQFKLDEIQKEILPQLNIQFRRPDNAKIGDKAYPAFDSGKESVVMINEEQLNHVRSLAWQLVRYQEDMTKPEKTSEEEASE